MALRSVLKTLLLGAAFCVTAPLWLMEIIFRKMAGRDVFFSGQSELLSLVPGLPGRFMRNAYCAVLIQHCPKDACLQFGSLFSSSHATVGHRVYLGLHSQVGRVDIGDDTIISDDVQLLSGGRQHLLPESDHALVAAPVNFQRIRIGRNCWIGTKAVIMANIGDCSIIGAGSVVTRDIPPYSVAVGVPARVIRTRNHPTESVNGVESNELTGCDRTV